MVGRSVDIIEQPTASQGQRTYCPVSGVVFQVKESSPHHNVGGHAYYFCCPACAAYFEQNRDRVLAMRGHAQPKTQEPIKK